MSIGYGGGDWRSKVGALRGSAPTLLAVLLLCAPAFAESPACADLAAEAAHAEPDPPQRNTLLMHASDEGCEALAGQLLADGASPLSKDRFGAMPLAHAARSGRTALVRLLLAQHAPVNAVDTTGSSALLRAIERNHAPVAALLLAHGADPSLAGHGGVTALIAAAYTGDARIVDLLLRAGADPRVPDDTGKPPIVYAAARAFTPVVLRLLDAGIDVNARYANRLTVLMWAAGHTNDGPADQVNVAQQEAGVALVRALLDRGARIDDADDRGRTALMDAAELGHREIIALLLARGANPHLHDHAGKTAADLAP